jgi:hypothetical protein
MSPYNLNPIANQFQAMNDLAEFDPLDLAVLDNTAKQQKNKIGYQRLKQGASQGKGVIEVATSLYDERDKTAQELAAREAETQGFQNVFASMDGAMSDVMGFEQPQTPGLQPPSQFEVGFSNYVGAPSGSASNLGYPQAPQTQNAPGSYTTALNTQLGAEKSDLYNIKRGYASDTGYSSAMAAVREALGKAPAVPTLQKPQLTQEDQALVALAGIFGGFQNMPRALQGALAGAQQRAEIENQQLQNKYQQEQTAYQRQLQGLQGVAETEAERRKGEQETLDRIYQQAINAAQGRISRTEAQLANAPIKEAQLANNAERLAMQRANTAQSAEQDAAKQAWQQSKSMLDKDFAEWTRLLKSKENKPAITKADYDGLVYKRGELIKKYASLGNVGSLFYIPQIGTTDKRMGETARAAYDYGIKTGRAIAKDISGSLFGGGDATPFATETSQRLQTLIDNYNKEQKKIQPLVKKLDIARKQLNEANKSYKDSFKSITPSSGMPWGTKGPSIAPSNSSTTIKLKKEYDSALASLQAIQQKYKDATGKSSVFAKTKAALEAEYKKLGLGDPFAQKPGGQNPGKKTSVNVVDTPLGTIEFLDA